jgi:hypothetical protein
MIRQILQMLKSADTPLSLDMISQQLTIEPFALEAMLDHLVQKGKFRKLIQMRLTKIKDAHHVEGARSVAIVLIQLTHPSIIRSNSWIGREMVL